jgi:hypothetical protein
MKVLILRRPQRLKAEVIDDEECHLGELIKFVIRSRVCSVNKVPPTGTHKIKGPKAGVGTPALSGATLSGLSH